MQRALNPFNAGRYREALPDKKYKGANKMTWEIVTGIIALVGFVVTIATYSSRQSSVLAKLEATLTALNETLEELKENNRASHKDIYNKLGDHDKRISKLEVYHDK